MGSRSSREAIESWSEDGSLMGVSGCCEGIWTIGGVAVWKARSSAEAPRIPSGMPFASGPISVCLKGLIESFLGLGGRT